MNLFTFVSIFTMLDPRRWVVAWELRGMAAKILGHDGMGFRGTVFSAGGDSLHALELALAIKERFGADVPLGALAKQSVLQLAAVVVRGLPDDSPWSMRASLTRRLHECFGRASATTGSELSRPGEAAAAS